MPDNLYTPEEWDEARLNADDILAEAEANKESWERSRLRVVDEEYEEGEGMEELWLR